MELYLMQHGQAVPEGDDPERPLSGEGVAQIKATGAAMKRLGITLDAVVCSPKKRSRQSAALVAEGVNYPYSDILETRAVQPKSPAQDALDLLRQLVGNRTVLVAGHLPSLEALASLLLSGGGGVRIAFDNGGLCRIDLAEIAPAAGTLRYYLPAAQLRALAGGG